MAGLRITYKSYVKRCNKKHRGFTMVELIVVLAIIALLAAAGIAAAIGYINRAKFDQNSQNAITVYQTAQAALSQKSMNGTIEPWVQKLIVIRGDQIFDQDLEKKLKDSEEADHSISKSIALTYNPNSANAAEDEYLYNLLSEYFYDRSVFNGTISLELNITATYGNGKINYSARVLSAFYSKENRSDSGWDDIRVHDGYIHGDPEFGNLPEAKGDEGYKYRRTTSFVGWFNGTSESITASVGVLPVFLPPSQVEPLEGHIVAGPETGYLFNLRNGETLDVAWAFFDDDGIERKDHNEDIVILLNNYSHGNDLTDSSYFDGVNLKISKEKLDIFLKNLKPETTLTKENINNIYDITRTSQSGFIDVEVIRNDSSLGYKSFPMTISKVEGDGRKGTARDKDGNIAPYYEFRLSIDCMMVRSDESADDAWNHYSIDRLIGYTKEGSNYRLNPRNISAAIYGVWDHTGVDGITTRASIGESNPTLAARAIDDPVYLTSAKRVNKYITYFYFVEFNSGKGRFDEDDAMDEINNKVLTGKCVVNTLFGDLNYDGTKDPDKRDAVAGTYWDQQGGNAVITSYRHLYNIRKIYSNKVAAFRIVSNLNWYIHDKVSIDNVETDLYSSEVKVFSQGTAGYKSPVMSNNLKIVSFPALSELKANHTLTSMSKANGTSYSINNVQLRAASFLSTDKAYGLICINNGTIFNIYTNNLNLVLTNKVDGSDIDYNKICPSSSVKFESGAANPVEDNQGHPIGGLIGTNSSVVGMPDLDENLNTIRMSNSIVMSGDYWKANTLCNEVGGVIGLTKNSSLNGVIEFRGSFAVVSGGKNTAGVIGDAKADVGARLVVDGNTSKKTPSEFSLPVNNVTGKKMSCVISGRGNIGGALAYIESYELTYEVSRTISDDDLTINNATGKISFPELNDDAYQIDVSLPENSLIIKNGYFDDKDDKVNNPRRPIGGAIGRWSSCSGDYASIRVVNDGYIIATDTSKHVLCGGAVGREDKSTISTVFIDAHNGQNSRIGNVSDKNGPAAAGGVFGRIDGNRSGTLIINAENGGTIVSRANGTGLGTGGVIGGVYGTDGISVNLLYFINVVNDDGSQIICTGDNGGAGGAIGHMTSSKTAILEGSVINAENYGAVSGKNYVGGTIGYCALNEGKIHSSVYGSITGSKNYVGGTIGYIPDAQQGTVQAILDGASVAGSNFVGGASGRIQNFRNDSESDPVVRTVVQGDSTVETNNSGSLIGGVVGDVFIQGNGTYGSFELKGDGSDPKLTVEGTDGVGGVAGLMRANSANYTRIITPDQGATNKLIVSVSGRNYIGGVIGKLRSSSASAGETTINTLLNTSQSTNDIFVKISVVLNSQSSITGTGDNVGGVVGCIDSESGKFSGYISISSSVGSANGGSVIRGNLNVGGAVGQFYKTYPSVNSGALSGISVDFSISPWTIKSSRDAGNDANVGGAVGFFNNGVTGDVGDNKKYSNFGTSGNQFPITVNLGSSSVEADGNNVGGAVGKNLTRNGIIDVTVNGSVSGGSNVGGALGVNRAELNSVNVNILGNGEVHGKAEKAIDFTSLEDCTGKNVNTGSNVGGAIGYNYSPIKVGIRVVINGKVTGAGGNVGGAIGFCYAQNNQKENNNLLWIKSIVVTLQGNSRVESDETCVGGALGFTLGNVETVQTTITGNSKIKGDMQVGGVVGFATSAQNITGDKVSTQGPGIIKTAEAIIIADEALVGGSKIGGVVGEAGYKKYVADKDNWASPRFETIRGEINSAKLFDTDETGVDKDEEAMIGGIVGHYCDGTCGEIILAGTGGVVELDDEDMNYPKRTYDHAILIQAKGRSVGGIVGLIGNDQLHQNVFLSNITVEENGPYLCVVSGNGADKIGGWIGSGNGVGGGIGYRYESDWNIKHATYEVNTVKVVYSEGSYVGGFMGSLDCLGRTRLDKDGVYSSFSGIHTWADVIVNLDGATVMGKSAVGGAIGGMGYCQWSKGKLEVNYTNYTNVGDIGNPVPGDDTAYNRICYEAGGAIGYAYAMSNRQGNISVPIDLKIDATSSVCGLADQVTEDTADFGVGGLLGRTENTNFKFNNVIASVNTDPSVTSVYSAVTNVGGFIGVMKSGSFTLAGSTRTAYFYYTNANVRTGGQKACAGGFVGRMDGGTLNYSRASGKVISTGTESVAGGFVGVMHGTADTAMENCLTTSIVEASGSYTGGFVGVTEGTKTKSIKNSYIGGHTYNGQYVANEGNVSGVSNVGGFIGANTGSGNIAITNCYSTASVLGTGDNIGGFIGAMTNIGKLDNCYSAGRVLGPNADNVGAFAGQLSEINNDRFSKDNKCKSLSGINGGELLLVGSVNGTIKQDTEVGNWIIFDTERGIRGVDSTCDGYPADDYLITDSAAGKGKFPLKPFINNAHYGDWPVQTSDRINIANAEIIWNPEKVQLDEVEMIPRFVFTNDVSAEAIKELLTVKVEGTDLVWDTDCTLRIENNVNVGKASVIISGQRDYAGTVRTGFIIEPLDIKNIENVQTTIVELNQDQYDYTGAPIVPILSVSINITDAEGQIRNIPLQITKDYYLTYEHLTQGDSSNIRPGEVRVTVHGTGNYTGVAEEDNQKRVFIIKGLDLKDATVEVINEQGLIYNGEALEPEVLVRLNNRNLVNGQDFTVSYENNVEAGVDTAKVIIDHVEGSNYVGQFIKVFTIKPATNKWIEEPNIDDWVYGNPSEAHGEHTDGIALSVEYYMNSACTIKTTEANSGTQNGDGGKPVNVGSYYMKAKAVLIPNGNSKAEDNIFFYNHTDDLTEVIRGFTITRADIADAVVTCPVEYHWTGSEIKPDEDIIVTIGEEPDIRTLVQGTDYNIIYPENVTDVGTVNFTIEGIGNFTGAISSGSFDIVRYHKVTFSIIDDYGDNIVISPFAYQEVEDGKYISIQDVETPEAPEGYVFDGWYVDDTCKQQYDFTIPVTSDNIVIYAKWKEDDSNNDNDNEGESGNNNNESGT